MKNQVKRFSEFVSESNYNPFRKSTRLEKELIRAAGGVIRPQMKILHDLEKGGYSDFSELSQDELAEIDDSAIRGAVFSNESGDTGTLMLTKTGSFFNKEWQAVYQNAYGKTIVLPFHVDSEKEAVDKFNRMLEWLSKSI